MAVRLSARNIKRLGLLCIVGILESCFSHRLGETELTNAEQVSRSRVARNETQDPASSGGNRCCSDVLDEAGSRFASCSRKPYGHIGRARRGLHTVWHPINVMNDHKLTRSTETWFPAPVCSHNSYDESKKQMKVALELESVV